MKCNVLKDDLDDIFFFANIENGPNNQKQNSLRVCVYIFILLKPVPYFTIIFSSEW